MTPRCPACDATDWRPLLDLPGRPSLATDLRTLARPLSKVVCGGCGMAANAEHRGDVAIADYENDYGLNTTGAEEHVYFTADGPISRSQAIIDWMRPHLTASPGAVLEVGCGQGNLLARLRDAFPGSRVSGCEASREAVALARSRGLDAMQRAVAPHLPSLPEADLVISFGVLEHVEDAAFFLRALRRACRPGGRAIISVPVQEDGGYDLFFEDHVWHFTAPHLAAAARRAGWRVLTVETGHPVVQGFGLLVCDPGADDDASSAPPTADTGGLNARNRDTWMARFEETNGRLANLRDRPLAVFGAGEMFALLHTYTDLGRCRIERLIDDDAARHGRRLRGVAVTGRDWLAAHPEVPVFVAVNPRYHRAIADGLSPFRGRLTFWC
ncbi:hypothetical protein C882_3326 [Caenispirillum salinarum AK4]|uniref:Uncharacterized protein n=1 Tax=Caenispirillum salinarum AK4 TaxID=1238182 RepID=K9GMZ3_9PROT|nr:methyltransferase domain-containing protein [Caenispirillum salinarum]EKV26039.1 hypothetical protein C882_3326 [Caenispirillum salinarum AK4]